MAENKAEEKKKFAREIFKANFEVIKRTGTKEMLSWLEDNGFFEAPASTKFHGNYAGGLAEHSNYVFENMRWLNRRHEARFGVHTSKEYYPIETIAVVALLHDVCKIDAYKPQMKKQQNRDGKWEEVKTYTHTNAFPLGHGEKSIALIMRHMDLTDEEMLAIRWHMGGFDHAVRDGSYDMNNAFDQCKLVAMTHVADMIATHIDEKE